MEKENDIITDRSKIPLKRVLGLFTAVLLVAGIMIGSGVHYLKLLFDETIFGYDINKMNKYL